MKAFRLAYATHKIVKLYKSAIGYQANFLKAEFCSISERNHTNMITTVDRYQTRLFYAGFLISYGIQNPAWNFLDWWMKYIMNQGLALLLMKARFTQFLWDENCLYLSLCNPQSEKPCDIRFISVKLPKCMFSQYICTLVIFGFQ